MRFSEAWLREFVDPPIQTERLAEQLTMAGLEVGCIEPAAPSFDGVVVGKVIEIKPHPGTDRLQVCQVTIGQEEPLQIVSGAKNVHEGMKVPTALIGAELPGGLRIEKSELRGIVSHGMLCSEKELGCADSADGLMELENAAQVGCNVRKAFDLDDAIIELDLTPNRADCLGVEGVAREVAALTKVTWKKTTIEQAEICHSESLPVTVDDPQSCPIYLGRVVKNVNPNAETPHWMKERLRRSGLRSLGPIVDVTNYVLMEFGQPLHAFDRNRIKNGIQVRNSRSGEKLLLLNDQEIGLDDESLVIADDNGPLALAGIMGGRDSAVSAGTRDIFLECAFFTPSVIMGKARQYGLHTDSSHRFERGVDPELQERALERATQLIISICGGEVGPFTRCCQQSALPKRKPIQLRKAQLDKILGVEIEMSEVEDMLQRLGMTVEDDREGWSVESPSFRFDIDFEADLIEEIARVYGYNNLPATHAIMRTELKKDSESILDIERVKDLLVDRGYEEAITYSFVDQALQLKVDPNARPLTLKNPISADLSVMRTSLWCGLIQAAQRNCNRQQHRMRLFETGLRFEKNNDNIVQNKMLAGLALGNVAQEHWGISPRELDFFDIKADLEDVLGMTGRAFQYERARHPALHPGQTAAILVNKSEQLGVMGMLHPSLEKSFGFDCSVFLFELDLDNLLQKVRPVFEPLSKFPRVRRDIAVVVDKQITAGQLTASIYDVAPGFIKQVNIFDVYQGDGLKSGKKSMAFSLLLEEPSRTLIDSEIDNIVSDVLENLYDKFNARLRD